MATHLTVWDGAACVEYGGHTRFKGYVPRPGQRGAVTAFTKRSRTRMLTMLARVQRRALAKCLFVTLTYPATWPSEPGRWKRDLDTFSKAIQRQYPGASFIWRLEAQKRGAPHYHLLVVGVRFIPHQELAALWTRIVGGDGAHLAAGTEVRRANSARKSVGYVSKYAAKAEQNTFLTPDGVEVVGVGRHWGIVARQNLPLGTPRLLRFDSLAARNAWLDAVGRGFMAERAPHQGGKVFHKGRCVDPEALGATRVGNNALAGLLRAAGFRERYAGSITPRAGGWRYHGDRVTRVLADGSTEIRRRGGRWVQPRVDVLGDFADTNFNSVSQLQLGV